MNLFTVIAAEGIEGNIVQGNRAKYIIAGQNDVKQELVFRTEVSHNFSKSNKFKVGFYLSHDSHNYYKTLDELLWADFHLDYPSDISANNSFDILDNDIRTPNNLIYENERFGHDFIISEIKPKAYAMFISKNEKLSYLIAANIGYNLMQRTGIMQNFAFTNSSLGKSDWLKSMNYRINFGLQYKLNKNMHLNLESFYASSSPGFRDIYNFPEISSVVSNLNNYQIASAELNYKIRTKKLNIDLNFYTNNELNRNFNYHYYDEIRSQNVIIKTEGLNNSNNGLELGLEYKIIDCLSINLAGSW
jgi:hypothetical protein